MKKIRVSLLTKVVIAIAAGVLFGQFLPGGIARIFVTFNSLFGNFLSFSIPLIILGLVTPAIGDLGKGAGKLLLITALIAYGSTVFSGFFTFLSGSAIFPHILPTNTELTAMENPEDFMLTPYFVVNMPPLMDVMTALLLSFTIGLGLSNIAGTTLRDSFTDFKEIIIKLIEVVIIPLLPLHIFGIFLNMTVSGQVMSIITMFLKVIIVIFVLHVLLLLIQFTIAGSHSREESAPPLEEYVTGLRYGSGDPILRRHDSRDTGAGCQEWRTENIAIFTVPLCATIHLAGSTMKIVACAMAIMDHGGRTGLPSSNFSGFDHDAGNYDGSGSGGSGRGYYGRFGYLAKYAGIQ